MSSWYYTQGGNILGPFSDEAMTELIDSGNVTFVTPVWDSDKKDEGREWTYAYATPLASYFSDDFPVDDMPSAPQTDLPPLPEVPETEEKPPVEIMPEPPAQSESAEVETPPGKTDDPEKKPLKSPLLTFFVIFSALFIIGLIIGAAFWYFIR